MVVDDAAPAGAGLSTAGTDVGASDRDRRLARLSGVRRWCAVFASVEVDDLEGFDLVVVGSAATGGLVLDPEQVGVLRRSGILVLVHLPVTSWSVTVPRVPTAVGQEGAWALDPQPGGDPLLATAARATALVARDYDGVYLDELHPSVLPSIDDLVRAVRRLLPDVLVLVQAEPACGDTSADGVGQLRPLAAATASHGRSGKPSADLRGASPPKRRKHIRTGRWS